jgi:hypothetical protein
MNSIVVEFKISMPSKSSAVSLMQAVQGATDGAKGADVEEALKGKAFVLQAGYRDRKEGE